ncbi:MAG TPA: hypothetical protein VL588_04010, partial [Bdellovibrionota bacterium]|nr:hypothetical protein [Bdellovibrionota bacterium]
LHEQLIANRDAPASKADYEAIRSRLAALFASGCWNAPNCTEAEYQEYQHLSAKKQSYDQAFEKSAQDVAKQETALKWLEDQAKRHPGPYATAEVTVVNLSYLGTYDSNTGTIHSGLKAAPIDASGHVAFKLNDLPMDVCAAASAGFLVGQNQVSHVDQGVLSGFVEGKACAGVELDLGDQKVGEIRDTVSARTFWDTGRDHDEYTAVDFDNKVELGDLMDSGFGIYGTVGLTSRTGVDPQYGVGIQAAF